MPKGVPLTEEELNRRRKEILDAALPLFLKKGFMETSMREIGDAAGVGKSTLYDYFHAKEDIMVFYFANELGQITARTGEIIARDLGVTEKLTAIMRMHLGYLSGSKQLYMEKMSLEAQRLSAEGLRQVQASRHAYQDMVRALIEEGIRTGEFRPVNALLAARSIFTLLTTAMFTSRPTGTPEEMAEEVLSIFFQGIRA